MRAWVIILLLGVAIAVGAGGGYWFGHRATAGKTDETAATEPAKSEDKPVMTVRVTPIRRTTLSRQVVAYGTVVAPPAEVRVVSMPFECRVVRLLVSPGQVVGADQPLIEVEASPATTLALDEAKNAAAAAERDYQLVKKRYDQKLATNAELFTAENALKLAQGRLQSLQQGGAGPPRQLKSDGPGIVSKVDVQIGQVVPIGNPLVEIAAESHIEVMLGVEPADAKSLKPGQPVKLRGIDQGPGNEVDGKIRMLTQRVDAATRLVDVMVGLPADTRFLLEEFVAGEIVMQTAEGLFVPRDAALPDDASQFTLFTVKDGVAMKHTVQIGIEADQMVQVIGEGLKDGDPVVVVGNYGLEDGMKVEVQPASSEDVKPSTPPAETQPSAAPSTQTAETQPSTAPSSQPVETQPSENRSGQSAAADAPSSFAFAHAVILRYSEGSSFLGETAGSFGVPQDDSKAHRKRMKGHPQGAGELGSLPPLAHATEGRK